MNIIEAYIKFFGKLIILLSGLSGSHKTTIAKFIERDFKIKLINIEKYTKDNYNKTVELNNGTNVIDWDNIESFDWDKINEDINKYKGEGVIVCGPYFPEGTITNKVDFHVQIKVQKQNLIEKRYKYVKEHPDKFKLPKSFDQHLISNIVNQLTYPYMMEYVQKSKIDKFINTIDKNEDQIYDEVAEFLFYKINEHLKNRNDQSDMPHSNRFNHSDNNRRDRTNKENSGYTTSYKNYDIMGPLEIATEWHESNTKRDHLHKKSTFDTSISKSGSIYDSDDSTSSSSYTPSCSDTSECDDTIFLGEFRDIIKESEYVKKGPGGYRY